MPIHITVSQLQQAMQIAHTQGPIAGYNRLIALGLRYPVLAEGVASANTFSGNTAIEFLRLRAQQNGKTISNAELASIKADLFDGYVNSLINVANANNVDYVSRDLFVQEADFFHTDVFNRHGLDASYWTLHQAVQLLPGINGLWSMILAGHDIDAGIEIQHEIADLAYPTKLVPSAKGEYYPQRIADLPQSPTARVYLDQLVGAGLRGLLDEAFIYEYKGVVAATDNYAPGLRQVLGAFGIRYLVDPGDDRVSLQLSSPQGGVLNVVRAADLVAEAHVPFASTRTIADGGTAPDQATADANMQSRTGFFTNAMDSLLASGGSASLSLQVQPTQPSVGDLDFSQLASQFGSTLGRLIGGSDLIIGTAAGSVISAVALSVGQQLGINYYPNPSVVGGVTGDGTRSVWHDFGNNLGSFGANAAIGSVSSYLAGEFAQSIGLHGLVGGLFQTETGNLLGYLASSVVANSGWAGSFLDGAAASGVGGALTSGLAGFFGQQLASLIVTPHTVAEATLASLGAAAGTIVGGAVGGLYGLEFAINGSKLGAALAGPAGVVIGAFVGFIIGDLFGSLFGHHKPRTPSASAETILQLPFASYGIGAETSSNGGNLALADQMAATARDTLNGVIALVTGGHVAAFVANGYSPTQVYGHSGSQIYVRLGGSAASQISVDTADQAVDKGVLWALPQTKIIGGDIFVKRAIQNSQSPTVAALLGDLKIATDYEQYVGSEPIVDAAIGSSFDDLSADDEAFYSANASFMTRALSATSIPLDGADLSFYNANRTQVDRIVGSVHVSAFAAGWIVTLARAAELRLDQYAASDFYGGLQGFLQSFGVSATGARTRYEDVTVEMASGTLSLAASGPGAAGLFLPMPGASADGSAINIAEFGTQVGYVEQAIGSRSTANDIEIAAPGSGSVTVYAGTSGYGYPYYYGSGNDGGSDIIVGAAGNDYLAAGSGGDWIDGQGGDDQIYGGAGPDVLLGGDGNDQIIGGAGREYLAGGTGNDYLDGGAGADVLVGGTGSDALHGGDGDDVLMADEDGGGTYDLLDGGNGSDTVSFERFSTGVTVDISAQGPSNVLTVEQAGFTLYRNQTIYSPNGQYRFIFQNDQNLVLYGPGNAVLWASNTRNGAGYRVTLNADGNLVMYKSNGSVKWQSYSGGHSGAALTLDDAGQINIDDQSGTAYWSIGGGGYLPPVTSSVYGDQWQSIENITGSDYGDHLTGTNYGSVLKGRAGDDVLTGGSGNDLLEGGVGADQLSGGAGTNTASYAGSREGVYVDVATGAAFGGDADGDTFSGIQNLSGSDAEDELAGDGGANIIKAGGGDDWIDGTLGYDSYDGGDGFDTADYSAADLASGSQEQVWYDEYGYPYYYDTTVPALSVTLGDSVGYANYRASDGSTGYQTLTSIEQVVGTSSDDSFSSAGSSLNVTWNGGAGSDSFSGGSGSDTYVFGHGYGYYVISDSTAASNSIQMTVGVSFDDLWVGNSGGTLQVGIRGEAGYVAVYSNFASGSDVIKTLDMGGAGHADLTQINAVYGGGDGDDGISASSNTYNLIFAYDGNDTIYAANGTWSAAGSVIDAGLGNDTVVTSGGDDQFLFERGDGHDYVFDGGGRNTIVFGSTVGADDVIYQVVGNDLIIGIKDQSNPALIASQVADSIQIVGGAVKNVGTTYGTTTWNTEFSVEAGGATTDLTKANVAWVVNYVDDSNPGGGGGGGGGDYGGGYGGGYIPPIVLDLGDDGLEITPVAQSDIVTRDAAGNVLRTSWVGPTNGILAYDRNGDGRIDSTSDISFKRDKAGAKTDLEGLAGWDSNGDGVLDAKDADFAKLQVWVDANQDGQAQVGEVRSLLLAGVVSIDLRGKPTGFDGSDTTDTVVRNTTSFVRLDGSVGTAYDVALARRALNDGDASSVLGDKSLGGTAQLGRLVNDPAAAAKAKGLSGSALTASALGALADVEVGSTVMAAISPVDRARWADVLDPDKRASRKALLAGGMQGADLLDAVRATKARPDGGDDLFGRGARTSAARLQAIVIDFDRSGADLIDPTKAHALVDVAHTGVPARIGWIRPSDGILAFDADGNGRVDTTNEVDLTGASPNARTAFQGLGAFDTDKDGAISASDAGFAKFLVWRDRNGNGRSDDGEVQTLAQAGITQLDLAHAATRSAFGSAAANEVLGVSKVEFEDGSSRALYDVALGFADADKADDPAPRTTPSVKVALAGGAAGGTGDVGGTGGLRSAAKPQLADDPAGVGRARGSLDGPQGDVVTADTGAGGALEWWRDPAVVGPDLASLSMPTTGDNVGLGSNRSSLASVASVDAATLQRVMLLRQSMAAMSGEGGGSAAVWNRGTVGDAATIVPPTSLKTPNAASSLALAG